MPLYLTDEQIKSYEKEGYLVIDKFWDRPTVDSLRDQIHTLVTSEDLSTVTTIFSTKNENRTSDNYFLDSGRAIRFFWEEKAWDPVAKQLTMPVTEAINKVGHGLHDLDPTFERVSYSNEVAGICRDLGQTKPLLAQSMYIFKHARIGGEVTPHQDGTFLYTDPQSCIGFWWALDDCTLQNGCLWAVPGSHHQGVHKHFVRKSQPGESGTEIIPADPNAPERGYDDWDMTGAIPLETPAGCLVVLHAGLVHYSEANKSDKSRHAYSIHVIDGKEGVTYPKSNWLQRPEEHPFREIVIK